MDGTETGWGRPAEPAPRWRALLDRARHGGRTPEEPPAEPEPSALQPPAEQTPLPVRPVTQRRPFDPAELRPAFDQAFDQPAQSDREQRFEARSPNPTEQGIPQRPINPLDPRRQGRQPQSNGRRSSVEPDERNSFFNPPRQSPPPGARDYPQARASAAPQFAPSQPVSVMPAAGAPSAPARLEWRQTRPDEQLERAISVLRRSLGRPRVLAFANPKGGVHKTTATVLAAATIGSVRGRGVLAWDDNELRGTLGLRAGSARHARTIKHLLADLERIESLHGDALHGELDGYLRHASDGSYDVLAGEESPRFAQRLDQTTVRRVMDLLRRTHDVICVDTGNNVESVNWQTVMRQADQLVITTVPREDAAFTADWMLDVLDESGMGDLVANAVTLISCPSPGQMPLLADFQRHFATRTRTVAVVPYDPALEVGSSIEYADLQPQTRQAWLRAASVMIEPFAR